jgi:hypothetical protein
MKHYEMEISRFIDNEIPSDEHQRLFAHLSDCEECRKTLMDFMEIKKDSRSYYEDFQIEIKPAFDIPVEIVPKKEKNIYKSFFYFSAAASVILGVLFLTKKHT